MRDILKFASIGMFIAAFSLAPRANAQGKTVTSHDGSCQVTVPGDWEVSGSFGIANSPDKTLTVAVSSPRSSPELSSVKHTAPTVYPEDKVVKDTPTDFQMEAATGANRPNVYRGIQIPGKVCLVEVDFRSGTIDDARKIALTLKSAK